MKREYYTQTLRTLLVELCVFERTFGKRLTLLSRNLLYDWIIDIHHTILSLENGCLIDSNFELEVYRKSIRILTFIENTATHESESDDDFWREVIRLFDRLKHLLISA